MSKMSLSNVKSGKLKKPFKVVLYGPEGIGKTTWAAGAPKPIFLDEPGGSEEIDVPRFPRADTWLEALEAVDHLRMDKHSHQTFVLDTVDWIEPLIWDHVCRIEGVSGIEKVGGGYYKGYTAAMDQWRILLVKLEDLRDRVGMNVVLLAHAVVRTFKNPIGEDYDYYQLKINDKAAGLLCEWPKALLFARYEVHTAKIGKGDAKVKGLGEGARVVHTEHRPGWRAKNRYGLPPEIPLAWADFERLARDGAPGAAADLDSEITQLLGQVDATTAEQGKASRVRCNGDPKKLAMLLDWLRSRAALAQPQPTQEQPQS